MLSGLERLARDTSIPTDRITELFRLAERREQALMKRVFNDDMNGLQQVLTQIMRDKPNPAFSSRYATEEQIDRAARPEYTRFGFSIRFGTAPPRGAGKHQGRLYRRAPVGLLGGARPRGARRSRQPRGVTAPGDRRHGHLSETHPDPHDLEPRHCREPRGQRRERIKDKKDAGKTTTDAFDHSETIAKFEAAAARIKDSDEARKLLEWKPGALLIATMPNGEARSRFLMMRATVQANWLTKPDDGSSASEDIEGL